MRILSQFLQRRAPKSESLHTISLHYILYYIFFVLYYIGECTKDGRKMQDESALLSLKLNLSLKLTRSLHDTHNFQLVNNLIMSFDFRQPYCPYRWLWARFTVSFLYPNNPIPQSWLLNYCASSDNESNRNIPDVSHRQLNWRRFAVDRRPRGQKEMHWC